MLLIPNCTQNHAVTYTYCLLTHILKHVIRLVFPRPLPTMKPYSLQLSLSSSNLQPLVVHLQKSLPWLPALSASSFNGAVFNALIATVSLQDTQCATAQVVAVQWVFLCLGLARVREPTLQHCWHPIPATPFRWQQLPALEPLDHSVPLSIRQHHLQEVSLWDTLLVENMCAL